VPVIRELFERYWKRSLEKFMGWEGSQVWKVGLPPLSLCTG
jgi:hypothetical protein